MLVSSLSNRELVSVLSALGVIRVAMLKQFFSHQENLYPSHTKFSYLFIDNSDDSKLIVSIDSVVSFVFMLQKNSLFNCKKNCYLLKMVHYLGKSFKYIGIVWKTNKQLIKKQVF